MPAATRLGDVCSGHGCFPPRIVTTGSPNFFINGLAAVRQGDIWESHCCGPTCHEGITEECSTKVFINGLPAARIGDKIDCGSYIAQGSPNTFFG